MTSLWIPSLWSGPGGPRAYTRRTRGGVFDPGTLTPTTWLRGDTGAYTDDGVTLASSDGDLVKRWYDKQAGTIFFLQGSAGPVRPSLQLSELNGQPVLRFSGTDNSNMTSSTAISSLVAAGAFTLFAVAKVASIATNAAAAYDNDAIISDMGGFWGLHLRSTPVAKIFVWDGAEKTIDRTITTGSWRCLMGRLESGTLYASVDGGSEASLACGNISDRTSGAALGRGFSSTGLDADVAEILVFNTALSGSNVSNVLGYLSGRYGFF